MLGEGRGEGASIAASRLALNDLGRQPVTVINADFAGEKSLSTRLSTAVDIVSDDARAGNSRCSCAALSLTSPATSPVEKTVGEVDRYTADSRVPPSAAHACDPTEPPT